MELIQSLQDIVNEISQGSDLNDFGKSQIVSDNESFYQNLIARLVTSDVTTQNLVTCNSLIKKYLRLKYNLQNG